MLYRFVKSKQNGTLFLITPRLFINIAMVRLRLRKKQIESYKSNVLELSLI